MHKSLNCNFIVGFEEAKQTNKDLLIIMEYCNAGNLEDFLKERGSLTEEEAIFIFYQILKGL